jgi:hypothetical protein
MSEMRADQPIIANAYSVELVPSRMYSSWQHDAGHTGSEYDLIAQPQTGPDQLHDVAEYLSDMFEQKFNTAVVNPWTPSIHHSNSTPTRFGRFLPYTYEGVAVTFMLNGEGNVSAINGQRAENHRLHHGEAIAIPTDSEQWVSPPLRANYQRIVRFAFDLAKV